jgi:hypothetical protein
MENENDPYLLACAKLGKTPVPPLTDKTDLDEVSADAYKRLIICVRAKNMIGTKPWVPVYDGTEYHYWPYFKYIPGFGFSCALCDGWHSCTAVGSRLEYRTRALAEEGAKEFKQLYNDYYTQ